MNQAIETLLTAEEGAAVDIFDLLDVNKDQVISKKEWDMFNRNLTVPEPLESWA